MSIVSDFQLIKYEIPKLVIEIPPDYDDNSNDSIGYFAKSSAEFEDGHWVGNVMVGFRKTIGSNSNDVLFEIIILGKFRCAGKNDEETKDRFIKFLHQSGTATLIPILRAALVSVSSITGHPGTCFIPNINVFEMQWTELFEDQTGEPEGQ